ncbi:hypothetical protein BH11CYA1_BH11CYA1_30580 [soil metagenome]
MTNQVLSKEEFADVVSKRIDIPPDNTLVFDREHFALVVQDQAKQAVWTYNLGNFFAFYKEDPEKLEEIIQRVRQLSFSEIDWTNYSEVKPQLRPAIRDRASYELTWAELLRSHGDAAGPLNFVAMCDVFALFPVVDVGLTQARIPHSSFDNWSVDFDQVFEQAQRNLSSDTTEYKFSIIAEEGSNTPSAYHSEWSDDYDAFRALQYDWSELEVKGERLFLLLTPSVVEIWGSQDNFGTDYALSQLAIAQDPENAHVRPLPPFVLYRRDGEMAIYSPDPIAEPVLYAALKLHQVKYFIHAYDMQKSFLESLPEIKDEGIFVSDYIGVQSKDSKIASVCSWTAGVDTLLPKTDFITFIDLDAGEGETSIVARARWDDALAILPDLLELKKYFPYRYETKGFPTTGQLQRLGMCDIF